MRLLTFLALTLLAFSCISEENDFIVPEERPQSPVFNLNEFSDEEYEAISARLDHYPGTPAKPLAGLIFARTWRKYR